MEESNLESWDNWLKLILPILQLLILIIPFLGVRALFDRSRTYWDRLSKRGYALCILGAILAGLTMKQSDVTNNLETLTIIKLDKKSAKRDSINQKRNEYENFKTKEMLAKYGYIVDSKNAEIVKILRDPNLRKTIVQHGESPFLDISNVSVDRESGTKFIFTITSFDATSYDINLNLDIYTTINNNVILLKKDLNIFDGTDVLKQNQPMDMFKTINYLTNYPIIYFRLHGSYRKFDETLIKIDNYSGFDKNSDRPFGTPQQLLIKAIKNYNIKNSLD